jgi:hypothetical protein
VGPLFKASTACWSFFIISFFTVITRLDRVISNLVMFYTFFWLDPKEPKISTFSTTGGFGWQSKNHQCCHSLAMCWSADGSGHPNELTRRVYPDSLNILVTDEDELD